MASNFLKNVAQKQAEKIDREYGAGAYGGSEWRNRNTSAGSGTTQTAPAAQSTQQNQLSGASSFLRSQAQKARERVDAEYSADSATGGKEELTPYRPANELVQLSYDALRSGTLPVATQFGMLELQTGAEQQRKDILEEAAQAADDRRRRELESELAALTQPGRVYDQETTARNKERILAVEQELSTLEPERSGRLKSGVQSILSSAFGAVPATAETAKQTWENANAQANDPEYQALSTKYSQAWWRSPRLCRWTPS